MSCMSEELAPLRRCQRCCDVFRCEKGVPGILVGGLLDLGLYFADVQNDVLGLWMGMSRLVVAVLDGGLAWLYMLLMSYMVICES